MDRKTSLVGTFIKVFDKGVLLTGQAGIGKSLLALKLLERGHSLVADDLVILIKNYNSILGFAPRKSRGSLLIRNPSGYTLYSNNLYLTYPFSYTRTPQISQAYKPFVHSPWAKLDMVCHLNSPVRDKIITERYVLGTLLPELVLPLESKHSMICHIEQCCLSHLTSKLRL